MPNALVTGSAERVPDIAIALKSAGFDILAAGELSAEDAPDLAPNSVDCYVQLPLDRVRSNGQSLDRARAVITEEILSRFETAARFVPLLAPNANVLLVTESLGVGNGPGERGSADPARSAVRSFVGMLADGIRRDCAPAVVRATVVADDRTPDEIAALAAERPSEPRPWWHYADVDPDLGFADWRNTVFCLGAAGSP